jgi:hypothetical protein
MRHRPVVAGPDGGYAGASGTFWGCHDSDGHMRCPNSRPQVQVCVAATVRGVRSNIMPAATRGIAVARHGPFFSRG